MISYSAMKRIIISSILLIACMAANAQGSVADGKSHNEPVVDKVVAVVGKNIVKLSDIENGYVSLRIKQGYENAFQNRCNILEGLLINKLLVHKGEVDSIEVTDDEVKTNVQYYLDMYETQYGSHEAIRQATGYTFEELKDLMSKMLRERMIAERVRHQLTSNVKITPHEVTEFFNKIDKDSIPYIDETFEIAEICRKPVISEGERERIKLELNKLRERILSGDRFSTLATLYSEDPGSATKGGELGFFTRGKMVSEFEAAAFALKPGEVSPVIETQFGFHIIQLIERRGNAINCRHILMIPKVSSEDLLRSRILLDSLATEIRLGRLTFAQAATDFSDNANKIDGGKVTHPSNGGYLFTIDELKQLYPGIPFATMNAGDISNATAMKTDENRDAYRIVTLIRRNPRHLANLKEDYDRIYNAALENAKQDKIYDWAAKTIKNTYIKIDKDFQDCDFQLKWVE